MRGLALFSPLVLVWVAVVAHPDDKTITLDPEEAQSIAVARSDLERMKAHCQQTGNALLTVALDDCPKVVAGVANAQICLRDLRLAEAAVDQAVLRAKANHDCGRCELSPDGKSLQPKGAK